jgi:hypothetical protein
LERGGSSAKQAGATYAYRNGKRKLHKTIASIWFNKTYRDKELRPNFINIKQTDHDELHCYHHVPTVNQRWLLQFINS